MVSRRQFNIGLTTLAFCGLSNSTLGKTAEIAPMKAGIGYGPLVKDPKGLLDLPKGFTYRVISELGNKMSDGLEVPDRADGMGCFKLDHKRVALVRNHELHPSAISKQPESIQKHVTDMAYDTFENKVALPGGTTNLVYNLETREVEKEFVSLVGTIRNCAGGVTPWGSWLTCEESVDKPDGKISKDHGYVFEVPATAKGLVEPVPLKAMGRFNHEAAAVDPGTGIVYQTEDRNDSLFYRFIPKEPGKLHLGGKLQALVVIKQPGLDTRNWDDISVELNQWMHTKWIDIENPESPDDSLRKQGFEKGAALFARGEGIHWADNVQGQNGELYFCCTSGGNAKLGQIFTYRPSPFEGTARESEEPGKLQLFLESTSKSLYDFGDNLTVTPMGHLMVCEDQYDKVVNNHLRGVTPEGGVYAFGRLNAQTELAGACFSPDGRTMFVNAYSPTKTLAITGPWERLWA